MIYAWLLGWLFANIAIAFWGDETFRHFNLLLANIWWAAAFAVQRWERK